MMLDRNIAPAIKMVDSVSFPEPEKFQLDNGIEVNAFNLGSQEVVQIDITFDVNRGNSKNPLVAKAVNELIGESTINKSAGILGEEIDFYGAFLESNYGVDHSSVSLFCLSSKVKEVLPLFEEAVKHSIFTERELNIYLSNAKQKFLVQQEKVDTLVRRLYSQKLYGDHYYGGRTEEVDFDETEVADLTSFYKNYYCAQNCKIIICGNYDKELYDLVNKSFGNLAAGVENTLGEKVDFSKACKVYEEKKGAIQSAIRVGKVIDVEFGSEEYFHLKVLNTVLGGYFGSRLMSNIREDKGFTYGIGSGVSKMKNTCTFTIATEVGADVTAKALHEIYLELANLRDEPILEDELSIVKNYLLGAILRSSDGPFSLAQQFKGVKFNGEDFSFFERYIKVIKEVDAETLQFVAQKHFKENSLIEAVAGKM